MPESHHPAKRIGRKTLNIAETNPKILKVSYFMQGVSLDEGRPRIAREIL